MEGRKQGETRAVILRTVWLRLGGVEARVQEAEPGDGEESYDVLNSQKGCQVPTACGWLVESSPRLHASAASRVFTKSQLCYSQTYAWQFYLLLHLCNIITLNN